MKKTTLTILSFLLIFLFNCNQTPKVNNKNNHSISIKNVFSKKPILFSEILDSISYTKLETNSNCLIGEIKKILTYKNRFYIHDSKTKSILWFTLTGNYIKKIKKIGKGPGEYLKISEFFIADNKIHLYDESLRTIFLYSIDGDFIKSIKTGRDLIRYIIPDDKGGYLCNNEFDSSKNTRTGIWSIDSKGKYKNQYLKFEKHLDILYGWSPMYKFKKETRFLSHLDNSIYSFKNDTLKKLYSYHFEELLTIQDFEKGKIDNKELEIGNYSICETNDWVISEWPDPNNKKPTKTIFHSKKNDDINVFSGYVNDVSGILGRFVKTDFDNKIYLALYSQDIINNLELILKYPKNNSFKFKDVKTSDNPIIQTLHFK